jgi:thiamine pyrophosphate-dependent acetolactate synthase large subunit-like protein
VGEPSWLPVDDGVRAAIDGTASVLFLVGPGVLRDDAEAGLRTLAAVLSAGVLNTWGAKGVFYWQSRHHLATIGLQRDDYALGGLEAADLVVTSGLDPLESPPSRWRSLVDATVDVAPRMLAPLAEVVRVRPRAEIEMPAIRSRLATATAVGWERADLPASPSALTRAYASVVGPTGFVAAEPGGHAGFFVARTLPTEAPRSVFVPAALDRATDAIAGAVRAASTRVPGRRCLVVADGPVDDRHHVLAERTGAVVAVWDVDAPPQSVADHAAALAAAFGADAARVVPVTYDATQLDAFVDAAGPVVAWSTPPNSA